MAFHALGKHDRHLADAQPLPPDFVGELDLKTVAVGPNLPEIDGLQRRAPKALEATGRIAEGHAGDPLHVLGRAKAEDEAGERPVDYANAALVACAQYEVGVLSCLEKARDIFRIMREVTVHFENEFVFFGQRPFEAGAIGSSEPVLFLTMQHVHKRMFGGQFIGQFAGAVGGIVVHHQQIHRQLAERLHDAGQIIPFVVGGHDDQGVVLVIRQVGAG